MNNKYHSNIITNEVTVEKGENFRKSYVNKPCIVTKKMKKNKKQCHINGKHCEYDEFSAKDLCGVTAK